MTSDGPRKIVVASLMYGPWEPYPGLRPRLRAIGELIDAMVERAAARYPGRSVDLLVLPEYVVNGDTGLSAAESSVPLEGEVLEAFSAKAREHRSYLTVPLNRIADSDRGIYRNSVGLLDRDGGLVGIYDKYHAAVNDEFTSLEDGITPGAEFPVFRCDFGRVGFQICYDINFDVGWRSLAASGAELVLWPTQSPQTARPAAIALENRYYVLSSTWRHNVSLFEPTGLIAAQIREPETVLVTEIDLEYLIIPWSRRLRNGELVREAYGSRVGFRFYEAEDLGIFWSNDPDLPIGAAAKELGLSTFEESRRKGDALNEAERTR